MNNLENEIRYAVFTPVFGVRSDRQKNFFRKNKNHKRSQKSKKTFDDNSSKKEQIFRY
jgi:hypothetical protein